ncbi:hypothetical protein KQX54_011851 [Cotesia glomerata]|uniref:Uncharacterized protein n=1 Tax=Cotesia glomerata TaxID=32391 RepID=A0AAV7IDB2_COTGL|nr:hypothetical protein KQX54_011851 [Cotesia glomerata]
MTEKARGNKRKSESTLLNSVAKKITAEPVIDNVISNTSSNDIEMLPIETDGLSNVSFTFSILFIKPNQSELCHKSLNGSSPLHYGSEDDNEAEANKQSTSVLVNPMVRKTASTPAHDTVLLPNVAVRNEKLLSDSTRNKDGSIASSNANVTTAAEVKSSDETKNNLGKGEVLKSVFLDNDSYLKAKSTTNMKTRLTNIMNGYWTDNEAAKFCIRSRSDHPNLKMVPKYDLNIIKNVYEKMNLDAAIRPSKKKGFDFDNFIRECASTNFKLRRQKLSNLNPSKKVETVDLEIDKLIDKQKKISREFENKENRGRDSTKNNKELLKKEQELQKKEKKVEAREKKILEYMAYLKATHSQED